MPRRALENSDLPLIMVLPGHPHSYSCLSRLFYPIPGTYALDRGRLVCPLSLHSCAFTSWWQTHRHGICLEKRHRQLWAERKGDPSLGHQVPELSLVGSYFWTSVSTPVKWGGYIKVLCKSFLRAHEKMSFSSESCRPSFTPSTDIY